MVSTATRKRRVASYIGAGIIPGEGGGVTPLGPTTATFTAGTAPGSLIALITGLQDGETVTGVTPNDGRLTIAGSGTQLVTGLSASSAGNIAAVLTSSMGRTLNMAITVEPAATVIPTNDWRLPITIADTGDATWNAALVASGAAKTVPLKSAAIAANSTHVTTLVHQQVAAPGALLFLDWIPSGSTVPTFTYEYSLDTTTGADGTWVSSPFTPWKPAGHTLATQYSTVGQLINIPAGARGSRLTIQTGASVTCRPYLAAYQLIGDGSEPIIAGPSMSIGYQNQSSLVMRAQIMEDVPGSDPIWINMARAGANSAAIKTEQIDVLVAGGPNGQLAHVNFVVLANGPNDRAAFFEGGGTYGSDSNTAVVGTLFQDNIDALVAKFGASNVYAANISFGRYSTDVLSPDYFLRYNNVIIDPRIKTTLPRSWSTKYDSPTLDDYIGQASDNEKTVTDNLHNNSFGALSWRKRRTIIFRMIYGLSRGDEVLDVLLKQVGVGAKASMKARLQALLDGLSATVDATALANRAAFQASINAIATTYTQNAVTGGAKLPDDPSISGALLANFDADDFARIDRYWTGQLQSYVDRKSGFTMAQASADPVNYPVLTPTQHDGPRAKLYLGGPSKIVSLSSSDAGLIGFLDPANKAYTVIMVFAVEALLANGHDMFSIGNASVNFLIMAISPNSTVPRIFLGDGGGSGFYAPGDSGVLLGQHTVIAFRNDGTGGANGVKYFRGSFTHQGANARVAAKVGTAAHIGRRVQGSSAYFQGSQPKLNLYNGALSDADILSVMAGYQQNGAA
ncbi:LamG domain-containing protein [Rhizobium sp. CG4]|uniref:LamG domain-containing protein n=1 Tax=Rhizobium sp. CG4 TaxID=2726075 RepID=UPI0020343617|nr:LamG domain-containing protein [Rhizobium sp. CG4]MCM2455287.1 LamG domain-containing protein [Rhizobium sp. CG4]